MLPHDVDDFLVQVVDARDDAFLAAEQLREKYPDRRLVVIDSLCSSSGYGLIVDSAADMRDEGKTILFSTHITADLEKCADRILYIRAGRLAADSAMDDFAGAYRIAAFDGEAPAEMKNAALGICRTRKGGTALVKKEDAAAIHADWQIPTLDEIMTHLDREEAEDA